MGSRQEEIDFIFRPSEPLPRPDFEAATTTDLANIAAVLPTPESPTTVVLGRFEWGAQNENVKI